MTEWSNPYTDLQHSLREALNESLRRTNGCVTRDQFMDCVVPDRGTKAGKMLTRLFIVHNDGALEWKNDIVTEEILLHKLDGSTSFRNSDLVALWSRSRKLSLRTAFPYFAPAGNKSQHVGRHNFGHPPVFGLDVLVRPPTIFSEDRDKRTVRNDLHLGEECMALVIHGTFSDSRLLEDGEYFTRLVVGDAFNIPKITVGISPIAGYCEQAMRSPLVAGDAKGAVNAALPLLSEFAHAIAMAFVN